MSTGSFCGEAGAVLVAESRRSGAARRRHEGAPGHRPACLRLREPPVAGAVAVRLLACRVGLTDA